MLWWWSERNLERLLDVLLNINANKNQGPVFGVAGADILIGDNCNA